MKTLHFRGALKSSKPIKRKSFFVLFLLHKGIFDLKIIGFNNFLIKNQFVFQESSVDTLEAKRVDLQYLFWSDFQGTSF